LCTPVSTLDLLSKDQLQIFPNPVINKLHINSEFDIKGVEILNSASQIIYSEKFNNHKRIEIAIEENLIGLYFLKVETQKGIAIKKIVVE